MPTKSKVKWSNVFGFYGWHSSEEFPIEAKRLLKYYSDLDSLCRVASFPLN